MASLDIQSTWSMKQILEEVEKTTHEISVIDKELDDLFSERVQLEQRVSSLSSLGSELNEVQSSSKEMSSKIHAASISGREISKQVSQLDIAQTRIEKVLCRVTLMLDLKETIKKVEECINDAQYDIAAKETYRILHQNKDNIQPIDQVSFEILQDLEHRLTSLIKKQCENAQYDNNLPDIFKYCSLYPYLGQDMKRDGLDIYCATINKELRLTVEEQNLTLGSQAKDSIISYVKIIGTYIDMVFTTITQNENELKQTFADADSGCFPILKLVHVLHNETDLALAELLNHYLETHEISQLVNRISSYNHTQHSHLMQNKQSVVSASAEVEVFKSMKEITPIALLDKRLDEISQISQELMAYDTTMRELVSEQGHKEEYTLPTVTKIGTIRTRLTGDYILLEQFNMTYQIYRVLIEENNIDTERGTNMFSSALSGNIYFLLKTLAIRSFHTYDVNVSCAIINNICNSLESIYKEWLDKKLRSQPGQRDKTNIAEQLYRSTKSLYQISSSTTSQSQSSLNHKPTIVLLNTIDESISDTHLITNQLEQEVNEIFEDVSDKDKFKIRQTLKGFEDISKSFERIIDRGIKLYSQTFHDVLNDSLNRFKEYDFEITDKQFNNKSMNSTSGGASGGADVFGDQSFVDILIECSRPTFYALSRRLTNGNFDRILIKILSYYLGELERFVFNHKFTFWGGMQFDKNRQQLQSYFSELTNTRSIRDQFIRIRCIAEILQFSKVNEATNYLSDDVHTMSVQSITDQSLTVDEIKKVLSLRTEFNTNLIQQLQL
eukprot:148221_1